MKYASLESLQIINDKQTAISSLLLTLTAHALVLYVDGGILDACLAIQVTGAGVVFAVTAAHGSVLRAAGAGGAALAHCAPLLPPLTCRPFGAVVLQAGVRGGFCNTHTHTHTLVIAVSGAQLLSYDARTGSTEPCYFTAH